jgi:transposase
MHASRFLPHLSAFHITDGTLVDNRLILDLVPKRRSAPCLLCGRRTRRVHSRYARSVYDLPCCGVPVLLRLHARRFVCRNRHCPRRIFCERMPSLVPARCRRTERLTQALTDIGFTGGGEGGSRLAEALSMTASPAHLLRLLRRTPPAPEEPGRVLAVDDWAKRKGKSYGTILVDLERHHPIDLLPDRTSNSLADWLREHEDHTAVRAALSLPWSNGQTEGQITRLKLLKRQMYGRANLDLLRLRMLHCA